MYKPVQTTQKVHITPKIDPSNCAISLKGNATSYLRVHYRTVTTSLVLTQHLQFLFKHCIFYCYISIY